MADEGYDDLQLIDPSSDSRDPLLHSSMPYPPPKLETDDDYLLLSGEPEPSSATSTSNRNFRSKKRNRVMQSCVACHSQKRKVCATALHAYIRADPLQVC